MRLGSARSVSKLPPVGRILLLVAAVSLCFILGTGSSGAQSDDHGNTISTATPLTLGASAGGRIAPGFDQDFFKLDLSGAPGDTHLWIYTTGDLDTRGWLYDSRGDLLASNDGTTDVTTSGGEIVDTNFRIPWTLAPGVYYVGVTSAVRGATGNYILHAKADDHGHFIETATILPLGSSAAGRIGLGFDRDFFKLDLSATPGATDVWIYTTGGLDTRGWLYDSNGGSYLVFNQDSYIKGREDGFHIRHRLSSGVYYISVQSWLTADGDYATGDYTLRAEAVTGPSSATSTATTLNLDSPTPGMIDTASDADYFRLVLTESRNLVIYAIGLRLDDGNGYLPIDPLHGVVLNSEGETIGVNVYPIEYKGAKLPSPGSRHGFRIEDDFDAGAYYIKVTTPADVASHPVPYTIHAYEDTGYANFIDGCEAATASLNDPQTNDPLFGCQWHLRNEEQGGQDTNVEAVWAAGINGEGINIAVVDDGMDFTHEDLAANVNTTLNHNYQTSGRDVHDIYDPYEHHGTKVAGIIAARDNGIGVRGVAPGPPSTGTTTWLATGNNWRTSIKPTPWPETGLLQRYPTTVGGIPTALG